MHAALAPHPVESVRRAISEQIAPVLRLRDELVASGPAPDLDEARRRLRAGLPAVDAARLVALARGKSAAYVSVCDALAEAAVATEVEAYEARLRRSRLRELLQAWLRGDRLPSDPVHRLARVAASIVGSAVLESAARVLVREGVPLARRGGDDCPCCGGHPDFAVLEEGARTLVCSRCNFHWLTTTPGCLGCGETRAPVLARVVSPIGYGLAMCNACGRYIKEREGSADFDPLVERAVTAQLDAAAEARGLRV